MLSPEHVGRISPQRQVQATHSANRNVLSTCILTESALDVGYALCMLDFHN
jgi:hypothetical protein